MAVLLIFTLVIFGKLCVRCYTEKRWPPLGLLLFMVATICLAASVALGRRGFGFSGRYFLLAVPLLCCAYYMWGLCGRPIIARVSQTVLCAIVVLLLPFNFRVGLDYGQNFHHRFQGFQSDLLAGKPASELLARYASSLHPCPFGREPRWGIALDEGCVEAKLWLRNCVSLHDWLKERLLDLHRAGIGSFRFLGPEPRFRELTLSTVDPAEDGMKRQISEAVSHESNVMVALEEAKFVCGIRVTRPTDLDTPGQVRLQCLQLFWKQSRQDQFTACQRYIHYWGRGETSETIWIYDTVGAVAVNNDNRLALVKALQLTLLLPEPP
jgi:hypothetical protein